MFHFISGEFSEVLDKQNSVSRGAAGADKEKEGGGGSGQQEGKPVTAAVASVPSAQGEVEEGEGKDEEQETVLPLGSIIAMENVFVDERGEGEGGGAGGRGTGAERSSGRVLLELDDVTLCTPQLSVCLLRQLSLRVKEGEHLLVRKGGACGTERRRREGWEGRGHRWVTTSWE